MTKYTSEFLQVMQERGFIHQCTDAAGLDKRLGSRITAYIGFDCTASSLHVGSLIQIMVLRWLQKTGHKPIILLGGGTTKVGDPSGKDESRKLLTDADIAANMDSIRRVFEPFISFGTGPTDAIMINNADWLAGLNYIDFLRDYGRHFSVNRMLTQDSVAMRLEREQNLSFLEFNYMILQSYDFVELHQRYGCALQIGGSDQWGNIIMGIDLQRRIDAEKRFQPMSLEKMQGASLSGMQPMIQSKREDASEYSTDAFMKHMNADTSRELFGLTTPLLATASGAKMGKTANGAVWLSPELLSPYDYWQFWRNTEDADVGRFLRLFTDLSMDEIKRLESLKGAQINDAKKILATEATALCHGRAAAEQAEQTAADTFEKGGVGADIPVFELSTEQLGSGIAAYSLLHMAGLATSGGEAKRLIRGGGARTADKKIEDENEPITPRMFSDERTLKLSAGKKKHVLVKLK